MQLRKNHYQIYNILYTREKRVGQTKIKNNYNNEKLTTNQQRFFF